MDGSMRQEDNQKWIQMGCMGLGKNERGRDGFGANTTFLKTVLFAG